MPLAFFAHEALTTHLNKFTLNNLTHSRILLKNGLTYFKNLAVFLIKKINNCIEE